MLTPAEAEKIIAENLVPFHREDCPLANAHGRVLRMDIAADRDLPPFDRVTMDGYAVRVEALASGVRTFRIAGLQAAGMRAFKLGAERETTIEVMTGAVLPVGADCVIPYEETTRDGSAITVNESAARARAGDAVHRRGADHQAGEVILRSGTRLTGREIAIAAACGRAVLTVSQLPKIAVVSTGDELVEVEMTVAAHQIRRSNDYALRAALIAAGYPNVARFHLRDVPHEIEHLLWHVLAEYDVIVLVGGVSKGKFDFIPRELERQEVKQVFHGIAQRPGKPMWFGTTARHTLVFALPGNPVSCYTCLHRYVLPALARASGLAATTPATVSLAEPFGFKPSLACLLPVKLGAGPHAERIAKPVVTNTSGDFASLLGTDGFVELPADRTEFATGTLAPFWPWE